MKIHGASQLLKRLLSNTLNDFNNYRMSERERASYRTEKNYSFKNRLVDSYENVFLLFGKFTQDVEIGGTSTEILPFIMSLYPNKIIFAKTFITGRSSSKLVKL